MWYLIIIIIIIKCCGGDSKSHSVTALGFKVKETAKFDVCSMKSISVAWKDSVDRSAMCPKTNKYTCTHLLKKESLHLLTKQQNLDPNQTERICRREIHCC